MKSVFRLSTFLQTFVAVIVFLFAESFVVAHVQAFVVGKKIDAYAQAFAKAAVEKDRKERGCSNE